MMRVLSLGWGVQSFTVAAMVALGELPPIDAAVHADTTHERSVTYEFATRWTPWLKEHDVNVVTVQAEDTSPIDRYGGCMLPAYMTGRGAFDRQCTTYWKRKPVRRWMQANRGRNHVDLLLGISLDEAVRRMRISDRKYITNRYPLVDLNMTRGDCHLWLERHNLEVPAKSACIFCPFQGSRWRDLKDSGTGEWQTAIRIDEQIRKARPPRDLFLHASCVPLAEADLSTPEDHGQLRLWDEECTGMCGV